MKSLKIPQRILMLIVAGAILFVQYKDQIIANLPDEYAWLSGIITILSLIIVQELVEKRVVRAEDIKIKEYGEYPEDHLKEEYNKLTGVDYTNSVDEAISNNQDAVIEETDLSSGSDDRE